MKARTTLWLFVVAFVMGAVILVVKSARNVPQEDVSGPVLPGFRAEEASRLLISKGALCLELLAVGDGRWRIERPVSADADGPRVARILNALESLRRGEVITAEQCRQRELTLDDYGLKSPRARVVVLDPGGRREIFIGNESEIGRALYIKLAGRDEITAVSRSLWDVLPETLDEMRSRVVLDVEPSRVERLEIWRQSGGFAQLSRIDGVWQIRQPVSARADQAFVQNLLDAIRSLRVAEFAWDPPASGGEGGGDIMYGVAPDEAAARVTVWHEKEEVGRELIIGKAADAQGARVYVRRRGEQSVFAVSGEILKFLSAPVSQFRDRSIFRIPASAVQIASFRDGDVCLSLVKHPESGWMITEPVLRKADDAVVEQRLLLITRLSAEDFVAETATNLSEYGLSPPRYSFYLGTQAPSSLVSAASAPPGKPFSASASPPYSRRLLVAAFKEGEEQVYARIDGEPAVFRIARSALEQSVAGLADPLVFRDRTMMAVPPDEILRITLLAQGREEIVARDDHNGWHVIQPGTNRPNNEVIQDVLLAAASLKALRIESGSAKSAAAYGLEPPAAALTLDLRAGAGIRKSLLIGFRAGDDGYFAAVQGDPAVFVLERGAAERLLRPLTLAQETGEKSAASRP